MKIYTPHPEQLDALAALFDAYRVFYRKESDLQGAKAFLQELMDQKQSVVFVAEVDGDLVGFTQLYPLFSSTNMAKLWLLNDLYVQPEIRGKAIGKALLKAAQDHCVATQAKGLSLETEKTNQIGNGLYPKMDFVCDDEHNFYYWENPSFSSSWYQSHRFSLFHQIFW